MGAFDDLIPLARTVKPQAAPAARSGAFDDLIPGAGDDAVRAMVPARQAAAPAMPMPSDAINSGLKSVLGETLGNAAGYLPPIAVMNTWADAAEREKRNPDARSGPTQMLEGFENVMRGAGQGTNPNAQPEQQVLGEAFQDAGGAMMFQTPDGRGELVNPDSHVILKDPSTGKLMAYSRSNQSNEGGLTGASRVITQGMLTGPVTGAGRATTLVNEAAGALPGERAAKATEDLAAFERSNVPVYAPAFSDGPGRGLAKSLADTPFVGKPLANAADASAKATAERVDDIAGRFGTKPNEQQAGLTVRDGIERFKDARPADVVEDGIKQLDDKRLSQIILAPTAETSFKTKQGALYERAWRLLPEEMGAGRAEVNNPRFMSAPANTKALLKELTGRNSKMVMQTVAQDGKQVPLPAPKLASGFLGQMMDAIQNPAYRANLQTLRNMRSEVRRLASGMADTEKNVLKTSDLDRMQSAITQDTIAQLQRNAAEYAKAGQTEKAVSIERSIKEFQRADQYTRMSIERMDRIEKLFNADTGEALARNITNAALGGGRGNIEMLQTLGKTLRPDEMGEIRSMIFSRLGKPVGSARGAAEEMAFSPNTFTTSWNKMSPEAKALLFDGEHSKAIDDVVAVANRLSNVDAMGNVSRSGTHAINVGGVFALLGSVATGSVAPVAGAAAGSWGLAYLLSRPAYAKWTAQYLKLRSQTAAAPKAIDAALAVQVNRLAQMAQHDPQLSQVVQQLRLAPAKDGIGQGSQDNGQKENDRPSPGKGEGNQGSNSGASPNHPPINSDGSVLKEGPKPTFRDKAADFLGSIHGGDATHKNANYTAIDALSMFPPIGAVVGIDEARHMSEDGSPVAAAGLGILSLLPGGGGAKKGAEKALGAVAREIEELAPRYRQLFGKDFVAPKARPGTPADEVLKGEQQTLDELRSAVASKEGALARTDGPTVPKIRDVSGERDEMLSGLKENPTTKAIPGRQGAPSLKEQEGLIKDFYKDGKSLPERPWGAGPLDYQRVVREQAEAKQALAASKQQIADGNKALRAAEKSNDKQEIARLKAELKAVNQTAAKQSDAIAKLNAVVKKALGGED